ncbi:hypothetical protein EYF80_058009 [Liparis tanakae]|uniref:Uncharacterized protein n=1 Tax=Liparis tanakae TaxID=230148 RepID=A0A4Z2EU87_9TELE|nr:hypothetical protein EYF80_058009 [Liparis tanakae]
MSILILLDPDSPETGPDAEQDIVRDSGRMHSGPGGVIWTGERRGQRGEKEGRGEGPEGEEGEKEGRGQRERRARRRGGGRGQRERRREERRGEEPEGEEGEGPEGENGEGEEGGGARGRGGGRSQKKRRGEGPERGGSQLRHQSGGDGGILHQLFSRKTGSRENCWPVAQS